MTWKMNMEVDQAAAGPTSPVFDDFLQTGRTGRRNALPDILGENSKIGTGQLPDALQGLSCTDSLPSTSSGQSSNTSQKT